MATENFSIEYEITKPGPTQNQIYERVEYVGHGISAYYLCKYYFSCGQSVQLAGSHIRHMTDTGALKTGQGFKLYAGNKAACMGDDYVRPSWER